MLRQWYLQVTDMINSGPYKINMMNTDDDDDDDDDDDFCLFDLFLYVPSTIFQLNRDRSSWVDPVLS